MEQEDILPIYPVWNYIYPDLDGGEEGQPEAPDRGCNQLLYNMGVIFSRQGMEKSLRGVTSAQFIKNYPVPHHEYVQVLCLGWW